LSRICRSGSTNPTNAPRYAKQIKVIEEECDSITHRVVESLHKTFITRSIATTSID
jgi:uncharacterized protein Yka (UPF0111/DUF47 family)